MKINKDAKEILEKIHLISGVKKDDVTSVLESLTILIVLNYLNNEDTYIPFIGNCSLRYKGDKTVDGKLEAVVECEFNIDDFLLRNIGQVEDDGVTDAEKILKRRIYATLGEYLNKE
jgi:hypothetical protein